MIPTAQLDPASLTLWYNPEIISQSPAGPVFSNVVEYAVRGDIDRVRGSVDDARRDGSEVRCAHLASVVWHEQRHFVDLILTNHGAFRVRQFLSLYVNLMQLLGEVSERGQTLVCPITTYADAVRAAVQGVSADPESVLQRVAEDVRDRIRMVADDRRTITPAFGPIEFGGEAQLEALAFFSQFVALDHYLGRDLDLPVQRDLPGGVPGLRYRWAAVLAAQLQLAPFKPLDDETNELDATYMSTILYASLASRRWGQTQTSHHAGSSSGFPGARLYGLITELKGRGRRDASTDELWEEVNEVAKRLWGRSAIEEMVMDYVFEEEWVDSIVTSASTPGAARDVVLDFHRMRGALIEILQKDPAVLLDPLTYASSLLPLVRPIPIIAYPSGLTGPLPPDLEQVLGYRESSEDTDASWVWASTPKEWSDPDYASLTFQSRTSWLEIVSLFAPLAKLLMNGCRHRTMLGPELEKAMAYLETRGISYKIDPLFEPLGETEGAALLFHLNGKSQAVCDRCHATIDAPGGHLVSPWLFRRNNAIAEHIKEVLGGGQLGDRRFRRDWSPWLVCDACHDILTGAGTGPVIGGAT